MKKILIAVPCMDMVAARFAQSLATLSKPEAKVTISFLANSLVYDARNSLTAFAVEQEADYILWLDSDMVFPPDTLLRMMDTMDANENIDILCGLYFRRSHPFTPVLFDKLEIQDGRCVFEHCKKIPDKLTEVAGCGFGCVLMKTDCLLDMAGREKDGTMWFTPFKDAGEDCAFCIRAREAGYHIYCDPTIEIGHMGYAPVTRQLYEAMEDNK